MLILLSRNPAAFLIRLIRLIMRVDKFDMKFNIEINRNVSLKK